MMQITLIGKLISKFFQITPYQLNQRQSIYIISCLNFHPSTKSGILWLQYEQKCLNLCLCRHRLEEAQLFMLLSISAIVKGGK